MVSSLSLPLPIDLEVPLEDLNFCMTSLGLSSFVGVRLLVWLGLLVLLLLIGLESLMVSSLSLPLPIDLEEPPDDLNFCMTSLGLSSFVGVRLLVWLGLLVLLLLIGLESLMVSSLSLPLPIDLEEPPGDLNFCIDLDLRAFVTSLGLSSFVRVNATLA